MGTATLTNLAPGLYTLQIYAFQTNYDVFGAQYTGRIQSVPEPASLTLMGIGVAALAAKRRRRQRARLGHR